MSPRFRILHLSDAHIGHPDWKTDREAVMAPLLKDISVTSAGAPPDLIIFSGDLVYGEHPKTSLDIQYGSARAWILDIHRLWNLSLGDIPLLLVPGNHDVKRSEVDETQTEWLDGIRESETLDKHLREKTKLWTRLLHRQDTWWDFAKTLMGPGWTHDDSLRTTSREFEFDGKKLGVIGLNSSWASCRNGEKGSLWLGRHQVQTAIGSHQDCSFRIAVVHHPVSWLHHLEETWVEQKLESCFDLLLHGHTHDAWYRRGDRCVSVSAGACWAGSTAENGYSWIDLGPKLETLELTARTYQDKGAGVWIPLNLPGKFDIHGKVSIPVKGAGGSKDETAEKSPEDDDTQIVGSSDISDTFPPQYDVWIARPEKLEHLLETFDQGSRHVLVTGPAAIGKTVLLAQLATLLRLECISAFISPQPHWAPQLASIRRDLANQATWIVTGKQLTVGEVVTDSVFAAAMHKLQRHQRAKRVRLRVIIDGLNSLPSSSIRGATDDVLKLFESVWSAFDFVITLDPELLPVAFRSTNYRTFHVSRFTFPETCTYLDDVADIEKKKEVWDLVHGHPAALSSMKRILRRNPTISIEQLSAKLPDLLSWEWRQVDESNSNHLLLLAAAALFPGRFDRRSLNAVLSIPEPEIEVALGRYDFIVCAEDDKLSFAAEPLRAFAAVKLKRLEASIRECIVSELMRDPESPKALEELPGHLQEIGRVPELLQYLSPDHVQKLLQQTQSWRQAIQKTEIALDASAKGNNLEGLVRFALHRSSLHQFESGAFSRSVVEALFALGRVEDAIGHASAQVTKEQRLLLLSVIAKMARERSILLPPSATDAICALAGELPGKVSPETRLEIATELVQVYPALAISLIEKSDENRENIDSALMQVSMRSMFTRANDVLREDSVDDITSKIGSEKVRSFTAAVRSIACESTPSSALAQIKVVTSAKDQIFLLRQWTLGHPKDQNCRQLIEYALDLIVKTTDYTPTAAALKDLATPLPWLKREFDVLKLVSRLSEQISLLKNRGFTEDYTRLQLLLAHTEAKYAEAGFRQRLENLYVYVAELEDLAIRCSCLALMCAQVHEMEADPETDESSELYSELIKDLETSFRALLESTADHYTAARATIAHVHKFDQKRAIAFAKQLNTEPRRCQAYADLFNLELTKEMPDADTLTVLFQAMSYRDYTESLVYKSLEQYAKRRSCELDSGFGKALITIACSIHDNYKKARAVSALLLAGAKCRAGSESEPFKALLGELTRSWAHIDDLSERREAGLRVVAQLAEYLPMVASDFWQRVEALHSHSGLSNKESALTVYHGILLSIRLLRGLLPKNLVSASDKHAVLNQIERLPSLAHRVELLSELALCYFRHRKQQEGAAIVQDRIHPLLDQIADKDRSLYERTFVTAAAAIHAAEPAATRQRLSSFESHRRDSALASICFFIQRKIPPGDPIRDEEGSDGTLSFNEASEMIELLRLAEDDSVVCWSISWIAKAVAGRGKKTFTQQQKADLAVQLRKLISDKLPNARFIKHRGYSIAARAEVSRFAGLRDEEFEALLQEARELPNVADASFVLAIIAAACSAARPRQSRDLLREALELTGQISTAEDKVERLHSIAEFASDVDKPIARDALRQASEYVGNVQSWRSGVHARRIVDAAHKLDKGFAEQLSSKIDSDPARMRLPKGEHNHQQARDLRAKLLGSDPLTTFDLEELTRDNQIIRNVWAEINGGKLPCLKITRCREVFRVAGLLPLSETFVLWMFLVENICELCENTDQAEECIRPMFDATLVNAELIARIASAASWVRPALQSSLEEFYSGVTKIPAGARQRAIDEIEQWCVECVGEYVLVVDASFRLHDLSLVQTISRCKPGAHIAVLASRALQVAEAGCDSVEQSYKRHWRAMTAGGSPGSVEVVLVGCGLTGELPISERMLLVESGGLLMSAPQGELGVLRETSLRRMPRAEAQDMEELVEQFLDPRRARKRTEPVSITRFTLT